MKLITVREFSLEATFRDPCQSFVLPEVTKWVGQCTLTSEMWQIASFKLLEVYAKSPDMT